MVKRLIGGAAAAGIAIFGGVSSFGDETTRNENGEIVEAGGVGAFSIQVGDCMQLPDAELVQSVEGVPCSTPHDAQAYHKFDMVGHSSYPGDAVIGEEMDEGCFDAFAGFVGIDYTESELYFSGFFPSAESWAEGDREIICVVTDPAGKIDYDARGSAR